MEVTHAPTVTVRVIKLAANGPTEAVPPPVHGQRERERNAARTNSSTPSSPPRIQALRLTEDVDINEDETGGFYVGWTTASEYLSYMVEVTEDGETETAPIWSFPVERAIRRIRCCCLIIATISELFPRPRDTFFGL